MVSPGECALQLTVTRWSLHGNRDNEDGSEDKDEKAKLLATVVHAILNCRHCFVKATFQT